MYIIVDVFCLQDNLSTFAEDGSADSSRNNNIDNNDDDDGDGVNGVVDRHNKSSLLAEREKDLETQLTAADSEIANLRRRMTQLHRENGDLLKAVTYMRTKLDPNLLNGRPQQQQQHNRAPPPRPPRVPPPPVPLISGSDGGGSGGEGHSKPSNDDGVIIDDETDGIPAEKSMINFVSPDGCSEPTNASNNS